MTTQRWSAASCGATRRHRPPLTAAPCAKTSVGPLPRSRYSSVPAGTVTVRRSPSSALIDMALRTLDQCARERGQRVLAALRRHLAPADQPRPRGGRAVAAQVDAAAPAPWAAQLDACGHLLARRDLAHESPRRAAPRP